jgi:hypothetical protein
VIRRFPRQEFGTFPSWPATVTMARTVAAEVPPAGLTPRLGGRRRTDRAALFALLAFLAGPVQSLHAQARLAFVHGDDLEGALSGAGAFAWLSNGDGTFTPCRIGTDGFDHNDISTEVFGAGQAFLPNGCTSTAPGGVVANLLVWNKANAGIAVGEGQPVPVWQNVDATWSVTQTVAGSQPTYFAATAANLLDFNPALRFDGLDQLFKSDVRLFASSAGFHGLGVARDERTNLTELRGLLGLGNGNMPAFEWTIKDGTARSPSEWMGQP